MRVFLAQQKFATTTSTPTTTRNDYLRAKDAQDLVLTEFASYNKKLVCTHDGQPRDRSTGRRPRQKPRHIGCPAQVRMNACVQLLNGSWKVLVTNRYNFHNHESTRRLYNTYPGVRTALPADVCDQVISLTDAGASRRSIMKFVRQEASLSLTMWDVHNISKKLAKERESHARMEDRLQQFLDEFA
ncbi:hypothetical protein PybrP1_009117 [[Pythium] brassicae (nom. inval.)]|nr:hypothetical protein PybrP1_009117 [[Pythium] brassicae (nom. inval.)]